MKNFIFLLAMTYSFFIAQAQVTQIPNNDFEQLNADGTLQYWGNRHILPIPYFNDTPSTDAHSGQYALLLQQSYDLVNQIPILGRGYSIKEPIYPGPSLSNYGAVPYNTRPQSLSFYYKFLPQNNDTAYVHFTLLDAWSNPIGDGDQMIIGEQIKYTLMDIPITYLAFLNTPAASYRLSFSSFYTADPSGTKQASPNTQLWIDDISLNNVTNIASSTANSSLHIYPNPAQHSFSIQTTEQVKSISLIDLTGKVQMMPCHTLNEIDCSTLAKGMYFIKVETAKGIFMEKLEVE